MSQSSLRTLFLFLLFLGPSLAYSSSVELRYFLGHSQKAAIGEGIYATCHVREGHRLEDLWEDMKFWRTIMEPALGIENPDQIDESELDIPFLEEDRALLKELYHYTKNLLKAENAPLAEADPPLLEQEVASEPSLCLLREQISDAGLSGDGDDEGSEEDASFFDDGTPPSPPFTNTGGNGPFEGSASYQANHRLTLTLTRTQSLPLLSKSMTVLNLPIPFKRGEIILARQSLLPLRLLAAVTSQKTDKAPFGNTLTSSMPDQQSFETGAISETGMSKFSLKEKTSATHLNDFLETLQNFSLSFLETVSQALTIFLGYLLATSGMNSTLQRRISLHKRRVFHEAFGI